MSYLFATDRCAGLLSHSLDDGPVLIVGVLAPQFPEEPEVVIELIVLGGFPYKDEQGCGLPSTLLIWREV